MSDVAHEAARHSKKGPRPIPEAERFARKYIPEPNSGCWLWTGALDTNGYAKIALKVNGKWRNSHASRLSLKIAGRTIPPGYNACHRCDNPPCVNPDHLFIGTQADNTADCRNKGRAFTPLPMIGTRNFRCKLTDDQVRSLRREWNEGKSMFSLGSSYKIGPRAARKIALGEHRNHVIMEAPPRRGHCS